MCSYFVHRRDEGSRACSITKNFVLIYVVYLLLLGWAGFITWMYKSENMYNIWSRNVLEVTFSHKHHCQNLEFYMLSW